GGRGGHGVEGDGGLGHGPESTLSREPLGPRRAGPDGSRRPNLCRTAPTGGADTSGDGREAVGLMTRMRRGIVAGLVTGLVVALAAVPAPVLAGSPTGAVGHGSAYGVASGTIAPVVALAPGRGDARVQVTRNGRFGIVHQGSSYDPQALHKVDRRTNRVTGSGPVPADSDSALAVRGNRSAYTIEGRNL